MNVRSKLLPAAGCAALAVASYALGVSAGEGSRAPKAVGEAVKKLFPEASVVGLEREPEQIVLYEVHLSQGEKSFTAVLDAGGHLIEVEEELAVSALPEAVRTAAAKHGKLDEAERVVRHGELGVVALAQAKTYYEVEVEGEGGDRELLIDEAGQIVSKRADDDDEDGDDDEDDDDERGARRGKQGQGHKKHREDDDDDD